MLISLFASLELPHDLIESSPPHHWEHQSLTERIETKNCHSRANFTSRVFDFANKLSTRLSACVLKINPIGKFQIVFKTLTFQLAAKQARK